MGGGRRRDAALGGGARGTRKVGTAQGEACPNPNPDPDPNPYPHPHPHPNPSPNPTPTPTPNQGEACGACQGGAGRGDPLRLEP
eukprot:scaffold79276_cov31-Phaeocystis_antarctica.AAC.2